MYPHHIPTQAPKMVQPIIRPILGRGGSFMSIVSLV